MERPFPQWRRANLIEIGIEQGIIINSDLRFQQRDHFHTQTQIQTTKLSRHNQHRLVEWSPGAVTSWTEVFEREGTRDELEGIQMRSINCRTTLCRLELAPTDPGQGVAVFEQDLCKLILVGPWQAPGFGKIANPDGQAPVAVIYLAREGYDLP